MRVASSEPLSKPVVGGEEGEDGREGREKVCEVDSKVARRDARDTSAGDSGVGDVMRLLEAAAR
jgi:hypothetical protein